jgi:hypothetical protein
MITIQSPSVIPASPKILPKDSAPFFRFPLVSAKSPAYSATVNDVRHFT